MAVPVFETVGTLLAGATTNTAAIAVPSGVAANDVIIVILYKENTAAVTMPSGFAEITSASATDHEFHAYWKRATGADTGTYSFSWTGNAWRAGYATRYSGCITTGNPYEGATSAVQNTAGTTSPAITITPTGVDRKFVWCMSSFANALFTPPTGFTERESANNSRDETLADKDNSGTSASSGSITGSASATARMTAIGFALVPPSTFSASTASMTLTF